MKTRVSETGVQGGGKGPAAAAPGPADPAMSAVYRKVSWRLLPLLFACYVVAYLDRVNIGFAQLQLRTDMGFTDQTYGLAAGMFFVSYVFLEVPSTIYLQRIGARLTLTRILVLWGAVVCATAFITGPTMLYALRLLLGVFEAGFAPGVMFYLTLWYPNERRAQATALFLSGSTVAGLIGSPVSGLILDGLNGALGLRGWQWMFLLEGLPAVILGIVIFFWLADRPQEARWLTPKEKEFLVAGVDRDSNNARGGHSFGKAMRDPMIYVLSLAWFTLVCGIYAISFWTPMILQAAGVQGAAMIGLWSIIPYGIGAAGMVLISRNSDRCGERRFHYVVNVVVGSSALLAASLFGTNLPAVLICLSVATACIFAAMPIFYAIPMAYFPQKAAAGGLALINCIGLTGGFVSPFFLGWIRTLTGSLTPGLWAIAGLMMFGVAILLLATRHKLPAPSSPVATAGLAVGSASESAS